MTNSMLVLKAAESNTTVGEHVAWIAMSSPPPFLYLLPKDNVSVNCMDKPGPMDRTEFDIVPESWRCEG